MSSQRLLNKLNKCLESGDYYESHQIYRTLYYRLLREKKHLQLCQLLFDGSILLMTSGQHNSGADLATLYIQLLIESNNKTVNDEEIVGQDQLLDNIRRLFELIPPKTPERVTFIGTTSKVTFIPMTAIRRQFATVLWREKNFVESRQHFVHSSDSGIECSEMLIEFQTTLGYPSEVDLFIAQFVLQVLCLRNKPMADQTFREYTSKHPSINNSNPPFLLPLLNFLSFLLMAIDSGKSETFKLLTESYGTTLKRDPSFNDYLSQIGHIYFGIEKASRGGPQGFFGNFIQSLLEDSDEEHSSNADSGNANRTIDSRSQQRAEDVELD
ncbi:Golgi to ER traffic protein 4 homolog [Oppia nitens]|uniref:Golgi to ER traffic protein 4 homolog n=1 Tax=Oppia nitens TaxID=1686743 RepID=UPI0023DA1561|nr:Golgi to ER traffic protein 4 homolog [Oppia nitens]